MIRLVFLMLLLAPLFSQGQTKMDLALTVKGSYYSLRENSIPGNIIFFAGGQTELLRLAPDGFYVRGVKLDQDEKEARAVYDAFSDWLNQARLPCPTAQSPHLAVPAQSESEER